MAHCICVRCLCLLCTVLECTCSIWLTFYYLHCRYDEGESSASNAVVSHNDVDMSVTDEAGGRDNNAEKSESGPTAPASSSVMPPVVTLNAPQVEMRR